ncbi:MAG TPA: hypothetical protein VFX86_04945 [Candidatus Saccharimonadales bacterium]|nr:hypothetical protein [Candidatus Saccharimonadales bacterium]
MQDLIVLGQIPGTNVRFGFVAFLALCDIVLTIYLIKKYHSKKLKRFEKSMKMLSRRLIKGKKKLARKLKPHKKRLMKRLVHLRDNVLGPKLKLLK